MKNTGMSQFRVHNDTCADAVIDDSQMKELIAVRLQERQQQDDRLTTRVEENTSNDYEDNWPSFWPILAEEWPLKDGVMLVRIFELLPPKFLLSDGRSVNGEFMINVIRSACAAGKSEQVTDVMKMEALDQILLYGNPRNDFNADLANNVAFLIDLNCPVNGKKNQYDPPLTLILRRAQPQQLKIIKMLIAAGADCETARTIANEKFENLWDMICNSDT